MSEQLKGDFIGFKFNNIHSSDMGIIRTSNGNRYENSTIPEFEDKTIQIPGNDGTYYYGSYYVSKDFSIPIAFDSMTELQFRKLSGIVGDKQIHELIFDEYPYKKYNVKLSAAPKIEYLCFSEKIDNIEQRVYKGEGTLEFVGYNPFASSVHKYLSQYSSTEYSNKDEWAAASQMLENQTITISGNPVTFDKFGLWQESSGGLGKNIARIYNPGDLDCDWQLKIDFMNGKIQETEIHLTKNGNIDLTRIITLKEITSTGSEDSIMIDSKTHLVYGMINGAKTGKLFNQYVDEGDFFQLPIVNNLTDIVNIELVSKNQWSEQALNINYNYRYY